jgi:chromosome segregation ATPase
MTNQTTRQIERALLRRLWQRIDGEQEGDAPSIVEMEDGLVRLFDEMRSDVERCAADENASTQEAERLRADVAELDRAYEREREHTRDLESRLADLTDDFHQVMDEDCESDLEKHCACVPHLRRRIKELEAERDSWYEEIKISSLSVNEVKVS